MSIILQERAKTQRLRAQGGQEEEKAGKWWRVSVQHWRDNYWNNLFNPAV